ncbi:hypothetical protein [Adonisia turfae]|uniref:Tyr recombinase domain-containing protein n=1 Tax=Adonisia turfae CCMR0081 TaxID=2292702 RepID=A0A6M0RZL7_9CYAN|nr:hypothetical protein [Adonisia turfae]NEZ61091.1 hypothetical protein [Adonisia turfae CCMR0081]
MPDVDKLIKAANSKLDILRIERRGQKLSLRGTLPKKPGKGRGNEQQRIPLKIYANADGVKVALARAKRAESDLSLQQWDWSHWTGEEVDSIQSAQVLAKKFAEYKKPSIKASSFRANYLYPLESLPNKPLTEEMLRAHIQQRNEPGTWARKNDVMVFTALCKFAKVPVDLKDLGKGYTAKPVKPDDLPTDEKIETIWESLKGTTWEWAYGMMATYGLRPHEIFAIIDPVGVATKTGKISIAEDSKTGQRDVWPLPDRWRERFNLANVIMPNIRYEGRDNQQLGQRMSSNLRKKIPHKPYALRHAWAIRSAVMGVPDSIAARWMGHSISIHAATYHAAISQRQHETIWEKVNKDDSQEEEK